MTRRRPEKPLHKQVAEFVIFHLADKTAFHPFTGTDYDAWHAYIHLVRLWGRTRSDDVVAAMKAVVRCAQQRNEDVMAVFKKSIPCILDWSDEPKLWVQVAPQTGPLDEMTQARIRAGIKKLGEATSEPHVVRGEIDRIMWPCNDGARVCHHENSKPYKNAVPEPGYTLDRQCKDCGAIWREKLAVTSTK